MQSVGGMSIQDFLALRAAALSRQAESVRPPRDNSNLQALLENKRRELGLKVTDRPPTQIERPAQKAALQQPLTIKDQAEALRAQWESGKGIVRKHGNFVDLKA